MKTRVVLLFAFVLCVLGLTSCNIQRAEFQNMSMQGDGHMQKIEFDLLSNGVASTASDMMVEINDERITSYSYTNDGSSRMQISFYSLENINGQEISIVLYPVEDREAPFFLKHLNQQVVKVTVNASDTYWAYQVEQNGTIRTEESFTQIHISPCALTLSGRGKLNARDTVELFDSKGDLIAVNQVNCFSTMEEEGKFSFSYIGEFPNRVDPAQIAKMKVDGKTYFISRV